MHSSTALSGHIKRWTTAAAAPVESRAPLLPTVHNAAVMSVLLLVIRAVLVGKGLGGLV